MKKIQVISGFTLALVALILGAIFMEKSLYFRLLIGLTLGYTLARGYFGFAGSVNRAFRFGSTKLLRVLMFLFVITAIMTAVMTISGIDISGWWVQQINLGLFIGAMLFGIGMAFASCCASGVLTDFSTGPTRALVALTFFSIGVFIGFPLQRSGEYEFISKTWFSTKTFEGVGVYFPDLFGGPFDGLIGAVILTIVLALIVAYLSLYVERKMMDKGNYKGVESEEEQIEVTKEGNELPEKFFSEETYNFFFGKPWSLKTAAVIITFVFVALTLVTGSGWGASTPFGWWFGKILTIFGVSAEKISEFTYFPASMITGAFKHPVSIQNFGILIGAFVAVLTMSKFKPEWKITGKEFAIFAIGGLLLGFGTRLSNGCNVGALYTPIANFSLSGWFFLIFMIVGGVIGNFLMKKVFK